jgi:hypothetical protein
MPAIVVVRLEAFSDEPGYKFWGEDVIGDYLRVSCGYAAYSFTELSDVVRSGL